MKRLLLTTMVNFLLCLQLFAQTSGKSFADKARNVFEKTGKANGEAERSQLEAEAAVLLEKALSFKDAQENADVWKLKAEIYNKLNSRLFLFSPNRSGRDTFINEWTQLLKGECRKYNLENCPVFEDEFCSTLFKAYSNALRLTKGKERSKILEELQFLRDVIINPAQFAVEDKDYSYALKLNDVLLDIEEIMQQNGLPTKQTAERNEKFRTELFSLAVYLKNKELSRKYYKKISASSAKSAELYQSLYEYLKWVEDNVAAFAILKEGTNAYPFDGRLIFSMINELTRSSKPTDALPWIKKAIEMEPDNAGLYTTCGQLYERLMGEANSKKETEKAKTYFAEAKKNYALALAKDPRNLDAAYSLGALYYNNAAVLTKLINQLPDSDKDEIKKKQAEVISLFDEALPHFKKAESIDANDGNTLIALYNIYSAKQDPLANEFMKRAKKVQEGGRNATSYFK